MVGPVHQHHDRHDERQGPRRPQHRQHVVGHAAGDGRVHPVRGRRPGGDRRQGQVPQDVVRGQRRTRQGADLRPALRPVLRPLLQQEAVQGGEPPAAEDVVRVRRRRQEADQGHQRRRQARPVGLRDGGREHHRERPLRVHPRPPERRQAVRRQQADVRLRPDRQGRLGLREPDRPRQGRRPEQRAVRRRHPHRGAVRQGQDRHDDLPEQRREQPQVRGHDEERLRRRRGARRSTARTRRS